MYQNKDRLDVYKNTKHKNMKFMNTKSGNFSALSSHSTKIVCYLSNIILNSQTILLSPIMENTDTGLDMVLIFDKLAK